MAELLHFRLAALSYILFRLPAQRKYTVFEIPKRRGGTRSIQAPTDRLRLLQKQLSVLLQDCAEDIKAERNRKDEIAHGFKRDRSIVTNAKQHRNRRYVFNVDLEDFFPSINFGRVRGYFMRDTSFGLHPDVATVIAQIACHENALPQGSPCSPIISNLIAHVLDIHLVHLASRVGCTYSRYADDLTFSTNKKIFPSEIAENSGTVQHIWRPGAELQRLVTYSGFRINAAKTHMQYRTSRQAVTGLVVNKRINVRREYRHTVRAMVHSLFTKGTFDISVPAKKAGAVTMEKRTGTVNQLHGMLGFIDTIDQKNKETFQESKNTEHRSSSESMYRKFLIYTNFYAAAAPVILCEGETDNVYLTHAIRSLAVDFPDLAETASGGNIRLKVRIFKYRPTSTARILDLRDGNDAGSSNLANFIRNYRKDTERFKAPGQKYPVIMLYDNDSGAKAIIGSLKAYGKKFDATKPFAHAIRNLYVVPTPLPNGAQESKIEDFFDAATKAIAIGSKTFSDKNEFDKDRHFGKKIFAHRVVRRGAATIDFAGFRPLLTNLVAVIKAHAPVS